MIAFIVGVILLLTPIRDLPIGGVPDISWNTNWGTITQSGADGRKFIIEGHAVWHGFGEIRADGTIYVLWIHTEDGRRTDR